MSIHELDVKVQELRDLRNMEAEIKAEITAIEDEIKREMLTLNTDTLQGKTCKVTWKTVITTRFDSAAFKCTHADLFAQYSIATTSRRFIIS